MIVESLSAVTASKPGLYQVRMAAHRPAANLHGGVYVTVDVPDFAKRAVSFSGVLVSLAEWSSIGVRDSMANLLPAEPTTSRAFSLLDRVHAYVRVYQAKGKRPVAVPVRIRIVDDHDRVVLDRTEPLEPAGSPRPHAARTCASSCRPRRCRPARICSRSTLSSVTPPRVASRGSRSERDRVSPDARW